MSIRKHIEIDVDEFSFENIIPQIFVLVGLYETVVSVVGFLPGFYGLETIDTRAFKLFEECMTSVKVAIELDLRSDDVTTLYTEYLKLKGLEELSLLYKERKDDLHEFHRAYKLTVDEGVAPNL
jgi:hypothetical protein